MQTLTLTADDPSVVNARTAEQALFDYYGLRPKEHVVVLPEQRLKMRVLEIGNGDPLVIVPGNTGDAFVLASLMAQLSGKRIFAINRPGGGLSEGMDHRTVNIREFAHQSLNFILEALGLSHVDVVAHSMGAHWSTLLTLEHPDKVNHLVLLGNPGNIMGGKPPFSVRLLGIPLLAKLVMPFLIPQQRNNALRPLTTMGHAADVVAALPTQLADAYFYFKHLPHYALSAVSLIQNMIPKIQAAELGRLQQPTILILGTKDNFAAQETGMEIVTAMPHGTFCPIEGAGHLPWLGNPEAVGRIILDFLQSP